MWIIRRHRPSNICIIIFLILITICLYITLTDKKLIDVSPVYLFNITPIVSNSSVKDLKPQLNSTPIISTSSARLNSTPIISTSSVESLKPRLNSTPISLNSSEYLIPRLDLTSNTTICQENDSIIIYILSTVTHIERRNVIRSTWASKQIGTCFVFVVGQVPGTTTNAGEITMKVKNEKKEYHDIVQIDHIETYANVVYKEVAVLMWSEYFYPKIPYLFKTDDDLIVDTILISSIASLLTNISTNDSFLLKYRPTLISNMISSDRTTFFRGGWAMDYQHTIRGGGKFGVSESAWPHRLLPAYCSGFGWFMSRNIRDKIVTASYNYPLSKVVWIGDVFLSGFLAKIANVKCTGIHIDYDQTASANCSCLMVKNPMLTVCSSSFHAGGGRTDQERYMEYQKAWKVIQLRHNLTHTIINDC